MCVDICQGAVPALLPFLIARHHFSYAQASTLVLFTALVSTVVQPVFGHLSDRRSAPWLLPVGPLLAAAGIAGLGISPSYPAAVTSVVLSGIGIASYHPEGSRFANYVSGARRATGMSWFSVGGNLGFALGPALVTPLVLGFGLGGTLWLIVIGACMAALLGFELGRLQGFRPLPASVGHTPGASGDHWGAFGRLTAFIACRSFVYFGLVTFVPLYFIASLGASKAVGNTALTVMLVGGGVGTLIGGRLADRIGRRTVLLGSMAICPPLIIGFQAAGLGLATVLIFAVGLATICTFSVTVVLGQEYLPARIGTASGVTLGIAIGLGGVSTPLFGLIADSYGVATTIAAISVLPVIGFLLAFSLPSQHPSTSGRTAASYQPKDGWR